MSYKCENCNGNFKNPQALKIHQKTTKHIKKQQNTSKNHKTHQKTPKHTKKRVNTCKHTVLRVLSNFFSCSTTYFRSLLFSHFSHLFPLAIGKREKT